ncbi:hypothetical protein ABT341_00175 [Pseudonocardia alni]|uniref:hypothetical protein n=1 Tax=Pseudonocardia alni TaxID=33907 RepID=UPI0033313DF4
MNDIVVIAIDPDDEPHLAVVAQSDTAAPVYVPGTGGVSLTDVQAALQPYAKTVEVASAIGEHVSADTPHPVYDDLPSLTLLFENGLI